MKSMQLFIGIIIIVVLAVAGFFAFNQYIYNQKQADPNADTEITPPFEGEVTGEYVCLPHKDTKGPQSLECAFGLKLADGTHYALDFGANSDLTQFQAGEMVTLNGRFTPVEVLSSDHWFKYDIKGIFTVKHDSVQSSPTSEFPSISLETPQAEAQIASPLTIRGKASGSWFFEATFPIILTDWDGRIIAETYAQAQSDWMTSSEVPFEAILEFDKPEYGQRGSLIFQKANPSGLPENDAAHEITIFYE